VHTSRILEFCAGGKLDIFFSMGCLVRKSGANVRFSLPKCPERTASFDQLCHLVAWPQRSSAQSPGVAATASEEYIP
jgi:hypothetical protein